MHPLTGDLVDALSQPANVLTRDTSNGYPAILGSVHARLLGQLGHLLGVQAGVGEHADLVRDVVPAVLAAELLEVLLEQGAHGDDAVGHALDLAQPLLVEGRVVEDGRGDAGTVDGRVRVERAHEDLDLGVDTGLLLGGAGDDGEGANTLAVETLRGEVVNVTLPSAFSDAILPCSWRKTERDKAGGPAPRSTSGRKRLCRYHPKQSPGTPCRRRGSGRPP